MISLSLKLAVSVAPRPITVSGFAYPNETLVAPEGTSYQWYIDNVASGTSRTLIPDVYDIGLVVRCVVDGVECVPVKVWHPNQISAVKHFWWAAQGAYSSLGNNFTDANAQFTVTQPFSMTFTVLDTFNGKNRYLGADGSTCYWNSSSSTWHLVVNEYVDGIDDPVSSYYYSTDNTTYPWQATTWTDSQTVTRVATTVNTLATDGQAVVAWRDIIGGLNAITSAPNAGLFESTDLNTVSIKSDANDVFSLQPQQRLVFNSKNNCYIFAGVKDTDRAGDSTHGVASIQRTTTIPKLALSTKLGGSNVFSATASSNNSTAVSANFTPSLAVSTAYNVLTSEALFTIGSLRLRVNGSQAAATSISTTIPNNLVAGSFIGSMNSSNNNFNGYTTVVILAAGDTPISDTDRSRIERFIGLLDGLNVAYEAIGAPRVGSDNPANAAEPDATAWVLMDGPFGPSEGTFYGGQSWRKMEPGELENGKVSYAFGDETVNWTGSVWQYVNSDLGVISTSTSDVAYPWLATTWTNDFTAAKITPSYEKTTNYPAVP